MSQAGTPTIAESPMTLAEAKMRVAQLIVDDEPLHKFVDAELAKRGIVSSGDPDNDEPYYAAASLVYDELTKSAEFTKV